MHLSSFALSLSWQFLNCQTHSRKRGKQLRYWCAQKRAATCCDYVPLSTILRFTFRSISRTFYGSKIFLDAGLEETSHACTLNLGRYIRKSYTGSRNDAVVVASYERSVISALEVDRSTSRIKPVQSEQATLPLLL